MLAIPMFSTMRYIDNQEKYDGRGYPNGLVADEIPLAARISALADVFGCTYI